MTAFAPLVLLALLLGQGLTGQSPITQTPSLIQRLETSAQVYFSDAHTVMTWHPVAGARLSRPSSDEIFTAESLCVFSEVPTNPAYGWRLTLTPISEAGGSVTVRVDWQRSKDHSQIAEGQKTSVQVTLKPGDSIPLDYIVAGPVPKGDSCSAVGMLLRVGLKADGAR